jgi:hypothetical protein
MAQEDTRRKSKLRREGEEDTNPTISTNVTTTQVPTATSTVAPITGAPAPSISPEVRDELTALMQELLLKTHELSFEYSTMECEELSQCPLAKKSKELFRVVKRLNDLVRKMAQPSKPSYIG